jgi:phage gp29-like protein
MSDTNQALALAAGVAPATKPEPRRDPPPRAPRADIVSAPSLLLDRWGGRKKVARGLTVQRIIQIYDRAERGDPSEQCDLFEETIRRDGHLRSTIESRIDEVAGKEWIVQAGGETDADIEAARLLEAALKRIPNMRQTIRHIMRAMLFGYSGTEILWDLDETGVIVPVAFLNVAHRRFRFNEFGVPFLAVAGDRTGEFRLVPLEPGRWLWLTRDDCGSPQMSGLMVTAVYMSHFKSLAIRDRVLRNQRHGLPFPIAKYPDNAPEEEKAAAVEIAANIGRDGYGAVSESVTLDYAKVDSTNPAFAEQIADSNAENSKLILGATLTTGEGQSAGSFALGTVHENRAFSRTQSDAADVGDLVETQLGALFVLWNGMDAKAPRLKLHVVRESSPPERLALFEGAQRLGFRIDQDQVAQEFQLKRGAEEAPEEDPEEEPGEDAGLRGADGRGDLRSPAGRRLAFNPDQPRAEDGKWTDGGGGTASRGRATKSTRVAERHAAVSEKFRRQKENRAQDIARRQGITVEQARNVADDEFRAQVQEFEQSVQLEDELHDDGYIAPFPEEKRDAFEVAAESVRERMAQQGDHLRGLADEAARAIHDYDASARAMHDDPWAHDDVAGAEAFNDIAIGANAVRGYGSDVEELAKYGEQSELKDYDDTDEAGLGYEGAAQPDVAAARDAAREKVLAYQAAAQAIDRELQAADKEIRAAHKDAEREHEKHISSLERAWESGRPNQALPNFPDDPDDMPEISDDATDAEERARSAEIERRVAAVTRLENYVVSASSTAHPPLDDYYSSEHAREARKRVKHALKSTKNLLDLLEQARVTPPSRDDDDGGEEDPGGDDDEGGDE